VAIVAGVGRSYPTGTVVDDTGEALVDENGVFLVDETSPTQTNAVGAKILATAGTSTSAASASGVVVNIANPQVSDGAWSHAWAHGYRRKRAAR
jgi:hypothetical protein